MPRKKPYAKRRTVTAPRDIPISESERESAIVLTRMLFRRMSPLQIISVREEWELYCEQKGWEFSAESGTEDGA